MRRGPRPPGVSAMVRWVLGVWLTLLASTSMALPMVSLNPSSTLLSPNQAFTVDVLVDGVEAADPLIAFGFDVQSGGGLVFNGATVAAPFFDDSGAFATTDAAGSTLPAVAGDGILLATLNLNAGFVPGLWDIELSSTAPDFGLSEGLFTLVRTFTVQARIAVEVIGGSAVPAPPGVWLIALGLALLYGRLRH